MSGLPPVGSQKPENHIADRRALAIALCMGLLSMQPVVAQSEIQSEPIPLKGTFSISAAGSVDGVGNTATATTTTVATTTSAAPSTPVAPEDRSLADFRREMNAGAPMLTLVDSVALALQNNPQRDAALAAVRAARARITTARSAGGLQVGLTGSANVDRAFGFPQITTGGNFGGGAGGGGGSFNNSSTSRGGWEDSQSLSVDATIPIYTGGRVNANKRIAQHSAEAQDAQRRLVEQQLIINTTLAYLSILRSQQLLEVTETNLDVARERARIADVRFTAGAAARLEVLRANTDLANARHQRIAASNALGQSNAALNTLLGRAPDTPLRIEPIIRLTLPAPLAVTPNASPAGFASQAGSSAGAPTLGGDTGTPSTQINAGGTTAGLESTAPETGATGLGGTTPVAGATGTSAFGTSTLSGGTIAGIAPAGQLQIAAGQSRNSLVVTEAQIRAAEASVDLARAQRRPNIGASILGLLRNPLTFAGRFLVSIGASVAQSLFDSGRSRGQIREAQAVLDQLRNEFKGQQLAVANEIEQSLLDLDSAQKRLNSTDTAVTAAREALRAAQLGYSAGVTTSVEVSDAQAALLVAHTDAVNARFDLATAQAQLAAAVGVLPVEGVEAYRRVLQAEAQEKNSTSQRR